VLRHVIVKRPEGIPEVIPKPSSYQPPLTPEGQRTAGAVVRERKPRPAPSVAPRGEKISTEELDKKLEEILKDTDLGV
ncbi:hypothetical protein IH979_02435, partial [Patescibacteria group bacterium]|nr:hypothetical protein [Patescibacteria group bacterium]